LECGDPEYGFTALACPKGHFSRFVAGHCKGRGFCTYCLTLRQRTLAPHLIERVVGNVPVRHVVLCFPPQLRCIIGYDEALLNAGFASIVGAMFRYQRRKAAEELKVPWKRIYPGGLAANHRVSATLETNQHFHGVFPDGVFFQAEPDGPLEFHRLAAPTEEEVAGIAYQACLLFCEALKARGFWETTATTFDTVKGILRLPKCKARAAKFFGEAARDSEGGLAPRGGAYAFHVFVGNAIELQERTQLEHLVNYILAPPFRDDQLSWDREGNIVLRLKRRRHDRTEYVVLTPYELMDRLASLVPRPNVNSLRYYGVYAPNAALRKEAIGLRLSAEWQSVSRDEGHFACPVCARPLQVVTVVARRRRTPGAVPPDTPAEVNTRNQDRIGRVPLDPGQGWLFS